MDHAFKDDGELKETKETVELSVQALFFEEDNIHFAYMPSLKLTGY